jgi:hypothetical protein
VEGIRIHGVLGPFLVVRQAILDGFSVGVRVVPLTDPKPVMWFVAEVIASGAGQALNAPAKVARERVAP